MYSGGIDRLPIAGLITIMLLLLSAGLRAQQIDSLQLRLPKRKGLRMAVAPLSLAAVALPMLFFEQHTSLSKYALQQEFQERHRGYDTKIDDQLRYAPIALVYGLNMAGVKGKNSFAERTILLSKSLLIQHVLVTAMKQGFAVERPEGGGLSFPSSHTARAFAAATFMHQEYKDQSPWYSIGAYSIATATAALRVANNHHWLPDVLVGAGVGILSTRLAYATHQYRWSKWMNKKNKKREMMVLPTFDGAAAGLHVQLTL